MKSSNTITTTVQRAGHTRKGGKVKAHTVKVQKRLTPAASEAKGPAAGPTTAPARNAGALGIRATGSGIIGIINGVDIDGRGEAGLHYCAEFYGCDIEVLREFGRLGRDDAARATFEYEWNERPELGHIEDFLVQTDYNSARLSTTAQAEADAEAAIEEAECEAELAAELAVEAAEEAEYVANGGRACESASSRALLRSLRMWRKGGEGALEPWQRAELCLAEEEFGDDWWQVKRTLVPSLPKPADR